MHFIWLQLSATLFIEVLLTEVMYSVENAICSVKCAICSVMCAVLSVPCTVVWWAVCGYSEQSAVYSMHHEVKRAACVQCVMYCVHFVVFCVQWIVLCRDFSIQCSVQCLMKDGNVSTHFFLLSSLQSMVVQYFVRQCSAVKCSAMPCRAAQFKVSTFIPYYNWTDIFSIFSKFIPSAFQVTSLYIPSKFQMLFWYFHKTYTVLSEYFSSILQGFAYFCAVVHDFAYIDWDNNLTYIILYLNSWIKA